MSVHRLELTQADARVLNAEKRQRELQDENAQLVERIVSMKQEQAAKLNDVNEFVERYHVRFRVCGPFTLNHVTFFLST